MGTAWFQGIIESFDSKNGFGYIRSEKHGRVLVHSRSLGYGVEPEMIREDIRVLYKIDHVRTGPLGRNVTPVRKDFGEVYLEDSRKNELDPRALHFHKTIDPKASVDEILNGLGTSNDFLSAALLLRDQRRYDAARRVYAKGLELAPNLPIVLSFAAFEKGIRPQAAREIYKKGAKLFRSNLKLYIDAGILETKMGDPQMAAKYFDHALKLKPKGANRSIIHRWRSKAYFKLATNRGEKDGRAFLNKAKQSLINLQQIEQLGGEDLNLLHRINSMIISNLTARIFQLFEDAGFNILQIFKPSTSNIDFIVEPKRKGLRNTYGFNEPILVRDLLTQPKLVDLSNLDSRLDALAKKEQADPGLAFLVVRSAEPLTGALGRRLESAGQATTIIPVDLKIFGEEDYSSKLLLSTLDQWIFRRDLYQDNFPVSGRQFFGRERQLKSLFTRVNEGHHVGIFGLRKVGKTSFLWRVREKSDTDLVAYLDLLAVPPAVKNCNYVFWLIGNELSRDLKVKYPDIGEKAQFKLFGIYDDYEPLLNIPVSLRFDNDLNRLRKTLSNADIDPSPKIVILIDEVERLLPSKKKVQGFEGYFDFFSYWRGQAQHYRDVVTVITGANPAITEQAQWEEVDNPVYKFYKEEFFPPFDFNECSVMVRDIGAQMGLHYQDESVSKIYSLTGGHPFIARRFCSRICRNNPARPLIVDGKMVEETVSGFMREDSSLFEEILNRLQRDFPDELKVLNIIANQGKISGEELQETVGRNVHTILHHLIGYQLIIKENEYYRIGLELLRHHMRN